MTKKTRDSNIELLRILAICGVVVLHYNGNVAFSYVAEGSGHFYILYFLEVLFICAVNLFILISGYFSCMSTKRRAIKPLELIVQVMVIGVAKYLVTCIFGGHSLSVVSLVAAMIPNNYFVFLYITLYLISPYINLVLDKLSQKQYGIMIGLCVVLFSVWPTVLDVVLEMTGRHFNGMYTTNTGGSQYGYSLINFALMYLLGSYLRRFEVGKKCRSAHLIAGLAACIGVLYVWQLCNAQTARSYANPFVIAARVVTFLLFQRISIRSRIINTLAKASFTCFLLHDFFLWHIGIDRIVTMHPLIMLGHVFLAAPGIFLVSWVAWRIYSFVSEPVFQWLGKRLTWLDDLISVSN